MYIEYTNTLIVRSTYIQEHFHTRKRFRIKRNIFLNHTYLRIRLKIKKKKTTKGNRQHRKCLKMNTQFFQRFTMTSESLN